MEKLLTPQEVAELLSVPPRNLDQWAYLGRGPAFVKVGRHRRYYLSDVHRWLQSHRHGGEAA